MIRRTPIRLLTSVPLAAWLATRPRLTTAGTGVGPDAAELYGKAFGLAEGLRPEDSAMLAKAA